MNDQGDILEMQPSFESLKRTDDKGEPYWSSRELCKAMGYSAYWKFNRVIEKAINVMSVKGMDIDYHINRSVDMVEVGSGAFRRIENLHLSRMACLMIAENADSKKVLVQQALLGTLLKVE